MQTAGMAMLATGLTGRKAYAEELENQTSLVSRYSAPGDLKITDLRVVVMKRPRIPIIRIDTNQGISGYGEVRDGASPTYALFLKSRLLGKNPCNIEEVFGDIKQFGGHGRMGGGVSGVDMALWDLTGKAYNIPVYQLLGGKHRDEVRLYADTTASLDPEEYAKRMVARKEELGFTFLKMDFGIWMIRDIPGALVNGDLLDEGRNRANTPGHYNRTEHAFTAIQITDKGIDKLCEYVAAVRDAVGYEIPLASDHYGHIDVNSCIRLGNALEPYRLAWLEDMVPWYYTDKWRQITTSINTPTLTGEDIYLKEEFMKLVDTGAVDLVQPDLSTAGGILETKKIGDYAGDHGIGMAMHFAGSPVSFMANVHCAAATRNFIALEHHSVEVEWWEDLVTGIDKPINNRGYAKVPDGPGLGIELVEDEVKEHMDPDGGYFKPTPEWDEERSWDWIYS